MIKSNLILLFQRQCQIIVLLVMSLVRLAFRRLNSFAPKAVSHTVITVQESFPLYNNLPLCNNCNVLMLLDVHCQVAS